MNESPYGTPTAPVADGPAPPRAGRPPWLFVALACFGVNVWVSTVGAVHVFRLYGSDVEFLESMNYAWFAFLVTLEIYLYLGRPWARWALAIVAMLAVTTFLGAWNHYPRHHLALPPDWFTKPDVIGYLELPALCALFATAIVFGPARAWFRR